MGDGDLDREPAEAPPWPPSAWPDVGSASVPSAGSVDGRDAAPRVRVSPAVVAFAVAVLVVACGSVAVGLWASSLGSPGTADTESAEPRATAPATTATPVTSAPDTVSATSGPTTTLLYRMQMATDPGGTFQLRIPQHWTKVDMTGDHAAEAMATFRDDPGLATKLATLMDALGSPEARMMVVDVQGLETESLPDVLKVEAGDALGLDLTAAEAAQQISIEEKGMTILQRGRMQTGLGETAWTVADAAGSTGIDGLQIVDYAAVVDDTMWKATYWSDRMPQGHELADVMMVSFKRL